MKLLYSQTYGLGKMGLAKSGTAMYEQRAERIITRSGSHSLSSTPCKAVARTLDEVLEGIFRVKVRVDGQFLDSRNHERIYRLPLVPRESDRRIIRYLKCLVWIGNGAVYELDIVEQVSLFADNPLQGLAQNIHQRHFLQMVHMGVRRNLYRQGRINQGYRLYRQEPFLEHRLWNVALYDLETTVPHLYVIAFVH